MKTNFATTQRCPSADEDQMMTMCQPSPRTPGRLLLTTVLLLSPLSLVGCGREPATSPSPSSGQVAPAATAPKVSFYAASRFAEQATFGPTPALVAELQAKGLETWIDEQFLLPVVLLDTKVAEQVYAYGPNDPVPFPINQQAEIGMTRATLVAPDQLRWRVVWSLSQFIVASFTQGESPGWVGWTNLLYRHAFTNYGELLRGVSVDPHMAAYLDNDQNRPKSVECPHCAPNENYARELMQLFSIGVFKLNADGTPQRDPRGRYVETYTQRDVEELARVLTGWVHDPEPPNRPHRNQGNWGRQMVPSLWPPERDAGRKVVMGREFPAGQSATKDLDDAVAMLMAHPNIAPFVALRLIQHLVKSDPTPAYVRRVAAAFRNNGGGVVGDMKAVLKAVLLDSEARRGDSPGAADSGDGKFREPWLYWTGLMRGLECRDYLQRPDGTHNHVRYQQFNRPESVFGYYAPTDRAPGSNLLAPEQRMLNSNELTYRLGEPGYLTWNPAMQQYSTGAYEAAGCKMLPLVSALRSSPDAYIDLLSSRYFRGAMPPLLRSNLRQQFASNPRWASGSDSYAVMTVLAWVLATPYYGVIK